MLDELDLRSNISFEANGEVAVHGKPTVANDNILLLGRQANAHHFATWSVSKE
jgi:hypothetical protein